MKVTLLLMLSILISACSTANNTPQYKTEPIDGNSATLTVYGMSCPLCSNNLDGQLEKIAGVEEIDVNLDTGAVTLRLADGHSVTRQQIAEAVKAAGFTLAELKTPEI